MKPHRWWCNLFDSYDEYSLVEHGTYGNRLNTAYVGASEFRPVWILKWADAGLPYPRSWFVLENNSSG